MNINLSTTAKDNDVDKLLDTSTEAKQTACTEDLN